MNGSHPIVNRATKCALVAALLAGGCRSTSSGVNNPFLAPNRVAPPSTRVLAPGQAQPYYQGDPLPVMQSATEPPANNLIAGNSATDARSSSGKTLAWNAPAGAVLAIAAAPVAANPAVPWSSNPPAAMPVSYGNEQPVAVPADTSSIRFALPAPNNPEPATPTIPQSVQPAGATPNQAVMLASYNTPVAGDSLPVASAPTLGSTPQVTSPWRTPQVSQTTPAPMYGMQPPPYQSASGQPIMIPAPPPNLVVHPPVAISTNPVAVQLRSVPSPPQPGDPMPRIRIPGYDVPQTAAVDGFRPRSSMQ